ncbi:MAG: polyprenyl synthetase family protein [Bacteroidota bacterium]
MKKSLAIYQNTFSDYLNQYISDLQKKQPKELYEPIIYILKSDAKHIRPLLCLLSCELYGKKIKNALPSALSIEIFHTFSLVHDDILDNSPLRRGKKTIHTKWNTNIAILSGDALLIESFRLITQYPPDISYQLVKTLSTASLEICEGQQEDMNFEKKEFVSSNDYLEMIRKKTSVLLGTALKMGSIISEAPLAEQKKLYNIGENIGIAFQIMDDYLDTFGNPKIFGKKIGNDILTNKKTFLLTKAIEKSNKKQLLEIKKILKMPPSKEKIQLMTNIYTQLKIDELAIHYVNQIHQKTLAQIQSLKVKNKDTLELFSQLTHQLIERTK